MVECASTDTNGTDGFSRNAMVDGCLGKEDGYGGNGMSTAWMESSGGSTLMVAVELIALYSKS